MPYLLIVASNVLAGTIYAASVAALRGFAEKDLLLLRMLLSIVLFLPAAAVARRRLAAWKGDDWARVAAVGVFGYALPLALGIYGLRLSSATSASLLVGMEPVAIVLMAWTFLGERFDAPKVAALLLGLTGAALIVFQGPPSSPAGFDGRMKGDLLLALHGACWALYTVIGKSVLRRIAALDFTTASTLIGAVVTVAWASPAAAPAAWARASGSSWLALVGLSLAAVAATLLWNYALRDIDASTAGNFVFLQPLTGVLLGVCVQGDKLTAWTLGGGALIIAGMWAAARTPTAAK